MSPYSDEVEQNCLSKLGQWKKSTWSFRGLANLFQAVSQESGMFRRLISSSTFVVSITVSSILVPETSGCPEDFYFSCLGPYPTVASPMPTTGFLGCPVVSRNYQELTKHPPSRHSRFPKRRPYRSMSAALTVLLQLTKPELRQMHKNKNFIWINCNFEKSFIFLIRVPQKVSMIRRKPCKAS